ncbi:sulfotransferase domain-containing protein [Flammeovirga kamogawensis]|uniref:Sulfotransferase domain-containing protein n=1 Tax=Flammeovirga kamogawensis TaxID=373891 RepID=A0ABX8GXP7_9BACT|nr:sulfotransferase domain-containing protein [Flammeovirga kamogawensis]MBB6460749.1 hypothetical protein [Flammeovirga kamogawensis]QWG08102.1 sulfotransferase domain-containing protein [Flammeovirga kamogawensis]TRX69905.1 hypothetical protein EO216_17900 [Flammeovirga kamogawensis]
MRNLLLRLKQKVFSIYYSLYINNKIDYKKSKLIFSDPRGGSTWLAETLYFLLDEHCLIWEPLRKKRFKNISDKLTSIRPSINKYENYETELYQLKNLFSLKYKNPILLPYTSTFEIKKYTHTIIKFCRGNNLLPWLVNSIDFKYKPIYFVRHPLAVVKSQIEHGSWDDIDLQYSLKILCSEYKIEQSIIDFIHDQKIFLFLVWCIHNKNLSKSGNWLLISYEELFLNPIKTFNFINAEWKCINQSKIDTFDFRKNSRTVKDNKIILGEKIQLSSWKGFFLDEEIKKYQIILNYFKINYYNLYDVYPVHLEKI